jgi:hypothetical protein
MQISCDTSKLEQSLKKFHEEAVRKMQGMVSTFSYWITWEAIENTPIGNITEANEWMYNLPSRLRVLPAEPGSAKGGWTISFNGPTRIIFPERASDENALNIKSNADSDSQKYKLGDTVFIMNSVRYVASDGWTLPKFGSLEGGYSSQAPNGIMEPTYHAILGIYRSDLKSYYEAS